MEWALLISLLVFLLGFIASWAWLAREAFFSGKLWGWFVLLVPLGGIIYGILAWREAHRPLLINLGFLLLLYMSYAMLVSMQPSYAVTTLAQKGRQTVSHWLEEWQKPESWEVDPEVVGTPVPDDTEPDHSARKNTPERVESTAKNSDNNTETTTTESGLNTSESENSSKEPPRSKKTLPALKTRVVRIGSVKKEDKLAPYRKLKPKERIARLNELMWQPMVVCLKRGGQRKGTLEKLDRNTLTLRQKLSSGNFDSIVEIGKIEDILLPKPRQPLRDLRCPIR